MFVSRVVLTDFRSYEQQIIDFTPGVNLLIGANGQGKTNVVEALEYLSTLSSHRVNSDLPLIRSGSSSARVQARVQASLSDSRVLELEISINSGRANQAAINRNPCRPRQLVGALKSVVFSPEDLAIVKGDPSDRRRFIDAMTVLRWPRLAGVKSDYDKVLRQRNAFLKSLNGRLTSDDDVALSVWDDSLCRYGAEIMAARLATLADMGGRVASIYLDIAPTNNLASYEYVSSVDLSDVSTAGLAAALARRLEFRRELEVIRGVTLVGPQRDDIELRLGDLPAKGYASHGECWSLALALRLGAFELVRDETSEPVLILDDVFAELDATRRARLADRIRGTEQVLITAAVAADIPDALVGGRFEVSGGQVVPHDSAVSVERAAVGVVSDLVVVENVGATALTGVDIPESISGTRAADLEGNGAAIPTSGADYE